jgi:transposase
MLSESNIKALIENQFKFIISARVKNMKASISQEMLNEDGYTNSDELKHKAIAIDGQKTLVAVFSEDRRRKDEYDRQKGLTQIASIVGKTSKAGLRGSLKKPYIKINNDSIIELDHSKIEASKKFDGYFGFITNSNLSEQDVIAHYRGLWQIEQSFRITKHNLKIRPVYHYKDRRIKAHFAICYLSLALIRTAEYKLKQVGLHIPIETLHRYLDKIKEVQLTTKEITSYIITDIPSPARAAFNALNLSTPKRYRSKRSV